MELKIKKVFRQLIGRLMPDGNSFNCLISHF